MSNYETFLTINSYKKVINLLTNLFSNGWILDTGSKDKKFCQHFSKLLSVLDYFEENCNFSEKKYFLEIEKNLSNIFIQNIITLQKYEIGTLKDYFVDLTVKTLINYCINIFNVERKILLEEPKVSLDTALNLLKNKVNNINKSVSNEPVSEKAKDFPLHKNPENKVGDSPSLNPKPTISPYGPLNKGIPADLKNFYPYTTKPKIIIKIKKIIGILAIISTVLSIIFLGFLIISDFGTYCFNYINSINEKKAFPDKSSFIQGYTAALLMFSGIILFRGLYNFLFLPSNDALKYRFPVWTSIIFFVILFLNISNFYAVLQGLISNNKSFSNLLNSYKYTIIVIVFLIIASQLAIFVISIVAMFNNPTVDINLIRQKIENANNNQNNQNLYNK